MNEPKTATEHCPVLIVGAGPVGLTASLLLSHYGVANIVVDRRSRVGTHPRARSLNIRSSEIMRQLGLSAELEEQSIPNFWTRRMLWVQSMAGEILGLHPWMTNPDVPPSLDTPEEKPPYYSEFTPSRYLFSSQEKIDASLFQSAQSQGEADIRMDSELVSVNSDEGAVTAVIRQAESGAEYAIEAEYLIAADGAYSEIRQSLGIELLGEKDMSRYLNVQFTADLRRWTDDSREAAQYMVTGSNPGVMAPLDTKRRWQCQITIDPVRDPAEAWTHDRVDTYIRGMIGASVAATVDIEILKITEWSVNATLADSLRTGRIFLAGDSAHQVPPFGGFGMNTGIQDPHNLVWKLAAVREGWADDSLLDTYDFERRQAVERIMEVCIDNAKNASAAFAAQTKEDTKREIASRPEFALFLGADIGIRYDDGAFAPDGTDSPSGRNDVVHFQPSARPGQRAPHLWVQTPQALVSTIDLFDRGFVLLAGADGQQWADAAASLIDHRTVPLTAYRMGEDLIPQGDFDSLYGISSSGCVLVRPDGHVAFRAHSMEADPVTALDRALDASVRPRSLSDRVRSASGRRGEAPTSLAAADR